MKEREKKERDEGEEEMNLEKKMVEKLRGTPL